MKGNVAATMMATLALLALSLPVFASEQEDRGIEESARKSYVFRTFLQPDTIRIRSTEGVVTLTGLVSRNIHQLLAEETVAALPGVKSVKNSLEVAQRDLDRSPDALLREKVTITLMFHRSVNSATTEVSVKDGIVTLRGVASSQAQKLLATEFTQDVEGVKKVINGLTIMVEEAVDDPSITAQVMATLLSNRSSNAFSTHVETKDGVVTLHGVAANATQFKLASKLANDVKGVKGVKNWMTINE